MSAHITLVSTSARVAPGLLTAAAWDLLRSAAVWTACPDHPQAPALSEAGVEVSVLVAGETESWAAGQAEAPAGGAGPLAGLLAAAGTSGQVAWLLDPVSPNTVDRALLAAVDYTGVDRLARVDQLIATRELPGSALLDAVAVMDRLRSPGGCPWDAEQTHTSLAPYLLEEAYEAYQAIEDGDLTELREELGDVLMQVLFHARVAAEAGPGGWDVDDVAAGLSAKLIRRHPHVFADVAVSGADEVVTNWDAIKATEKNRKSVTEGVPLSAPALSLTAKLLRRAGKLGLPLDLALPAVSPAPGASAAPEVTEAPVAAPGSAGLTALVAELARGLDADPGTGPAVAERSVGDLLFVAVALAAALDVDAESALRGRARSFRDNLARAEHAALERGVEPRGLDAAGWSALWRSAATSPMTASAPTATTEPSAGGS
ncbi:XTP/dITP diphosphohydrolase [Parafrankia irregularis]|uniref:XTP/dITP diphosphohydrolase n=1 Tax=Parafrankia irregularis TaxID=795642 RepID=A0A0S4QSZ8_9ACTN|nr:MULTISPECIES: MazG family protein [Parafrankia]MBE3205057.1 MazG family protein [Parafrankia sp. CH37]CUU58721.1 XTP/dITP diphosphohydrolase [Parafrankia irregularis]